MNMYICIPAHCIYIYIYMYIYIYVYQLIGLVDRVFANGLGDLGSIPG